MVLFASVVVAVGLLVVLFSWVFQRRLIYLPSTGAVPSAASMLAGAPGCTTPLAAVRHLS